MGNVLLRSLRVNDDNVIISMNKLVFFNNDLKHILKHLFKVFSNHKKCIVDQSNNNVATWKYSNLLTCNQILPKSMKYTFLNKLVMIMGFAKGLQLI